MLDNSIPLKLWFVLQPVLDSIKYCNNDNELSSASTSNICEAIN